MGRGANSYIRLSDKNKILGIKKCLYCGCKDNLHIEHIISLQKGGTSDLPNLTRSCNRCNSFKGVFSVEEFLVRMIKKREEARNYGLRVINKIRSAKRRNTVGFKYQYYNSKVSLSRIEHSYFTSIINSILNDNYYPKFTYL